jgi:hypothetical protein
VRERLRDNARRESEIRREVEMFGRFLQGADDLRKRLADLARFRSAYLEILAVAEQLEEKARDAHIRADSAAIVDALFGGG